MTNTLQKKLNEILTDKNTNLLPENLKKGIRCLGVDGTLEASTSSGGVKQFNTVEEMNASTGNKDGDLAVVYRNEMKPVSNGDIITSMTFPKTVVFAEAIASDYNDRLRGENIYADIMLSTSSFRFYDMNGTIPKISYSSTDGITYTRTDSNEDTYDVGSLTILNLDEHICQFIQTGGNVFGGLYEYDIKTSKYAFTIDGNTFFLPEDFVSKYSDSSYDDGLGARPFYDYGGAVIEILEYDEHNIITNFNWYQSGGGGQLRQLQKDGKMYFAADTYGGLSIRHYNNGTMTGDNYDSNPSDNYLDWNPSPGYELLCNSGSGKFRAIKEITSNTKLGLFETHANSYWNNIKYVYSVDNNVASITTTPSYISNTHDIAAYNIAKTQLTTLADDVYLTDFYGKNGVETGTLTKNISYSFADINAEIYNKIQKAYNAMEPKVLTDTDKTIDKNIYVIPVNAQNQPLLDTSQLTNTSGLFQSCTNLTSIPSLDISNSTDASNMFQGCKNLEAIPSLNTSKITTMFSTFYGCESLTTIPLLDTSKVKRMRSMFSGCTNLVEVPLLNTNIVTDMIGMFYECASLTTIPLLNTGVVTNVSSMFFGCANLTSIPELNTSSATKMGAMFSSCKNLTTVPVLDASKVTDMMYMFSGCKSLSEESLNNILAMCANATKMTSNKTLKLLGLTEEQATKCTTLSNYSAFTAAGWTTGY